MDKNIKSEHLQNSKSINLKAGQYVLFDENVIHYGGCNNSDKRRAVAIFRFSASDIISSIFYDTNRVKLINTSFNEKIGFISDFKNHTL